MGAHKDFHHIQVKHSLYVCIFLFGESLIIISNISVLLFNLSSLLLNLVWIT